jgi:hypothetical protein
MQYRGNREFLTGETPMPTVKRFAIVGWLLWVVPGAASAQSNVALGKAVTASGTVQGAALSTLVDGVFLPDQTQWQTGTVYWTNPGVQIFIDLLGSYQITGFIAQVDNNDTYRLSYWDAVTSVWITALDFSPTDLWGVRTFPNHADNSEQHLFTTPFTTSLLRFEALAGDAAYSASEIQLFGTLASTTVPEPASVLLIGSGLAGLAVLRRRRGGPPSPGVGAIG